MIHSWSHIMKSFIELLLLCRNVIFDSYFLLCCALCSVLLFCFWIRHSIQSLGNRIHTINISFHFVSFSILAFAFFFVSIVRNVSFFGYGFWLSIRWMKFKWMSSVCDDEYIMSIVENVRSCIVNTRALTHKHECMSEYVRVRITSMERTKQNNVQFNASNRIAKSVCLFRLAAVHCFLLYTI